MSPRRIRAAIAIFFAAASAVAPPGSAAAGERVIYAFKAGTDGSGPRAALAVDPRGAVYGTTVGGGAGFGTVYRLTPPAAAGGAWGYVQLYAFKGGTDGVTPEGGLVLDPASGAAYGTTATGGANGFGTVFRLTPPLPPATGWTKTTLHSFKAGVDGAYPRARLAFDGTSGALYGTTEGGGAPGAGVVFKLAPGATDTCTVPTWTEQVIYSFKGSTDGATPYAGVTVDPSGALYGTTYYGGSGFGTVYKLTPPVPPSKTWTKATLHRFAGGAAGANPYAGLILDSRGALYGTTRYGGSKDGGTAYRLEPPVAPATAWAKTVLTSFRLPPDGASPYAALALDSTTGSLFGTTQWGGTTGNGSVYRLDRPVPPAAFWTRTTVYGFRNSPDGSSPYSDLVFGPAGALYGTTYAGGSGAGTVFEIR